VRTPRDELVAEVVIALTDTLRDDLDVADMLYALTTACVELLDVDAAGMLLVDERGRLVPVAATHDGSEHLERLQVLIHEGPCLDAVRALTAVSSVDLDQDAGRWPEFVAQARAEGFRAAHAEPLALRAEVVGGLNLFRNQPGPLPAADARIAHLLATGAAIGILHRRAHRDVETVNGQLQQALTSRVVIEQAKGVIAERHDLEPEAAFARMRSHARNHGQTLSLVARAVLDKSLDPG
jgi:transcriptional regulator with GAF, ATPase, and Fis domain